VWGRAVELKGTQEDIERCPPKERVWWVMLTVQQTLPGEAMVRW